MLKPKALPIFAGAAALGFAALFTSPANADTFTSILTVPNNTLAGLPGPFGTVTVTTPSPNSTTATITFDANTALNYSFIDSSIVDANINASSFTIGNFTGTPAPGSSFNVANLTNGGSGNVDGFGVFNQTVNNKDGFAQRAIEVDFTVTDTSGTFASAASALAFNSLGFDAAAHVANVDGSLTGFVAEVVPAPEIGHGVPVLLAVGGMLLGFRLWGRSSKRRSPGTGTAAAA
jgi:hypothetical protein